MVTVINGQPIVEEQLYSLAIGCAILQGLDNNEPIVGFVKTISADTMASLEEGSTDLNNLIIGHFAKSILYDIIMNHHFDDMDANKDGKISKEELSVVAQASQPGVGSLLVDKLFNIADEDGSGFISRDEMHRLVSTANNGTKA
jgi:ribosomal protein S18 acetylase RimI-like enzyme